MVGNQNFSIASSVLTSSLGGQGMVGNQNRARLRALAR